MKGDQTMCKEDQATTYKDELVQQVVRTTEQLLADVDTVSLYDGFTVFINTLHDKLQNLDCDDQTHTQINRTMLLLTPVVVVLRAMIMHLETEGSTDDPELRKARIEHFAHMDLVARKFELNEHFKGSQK